MPLPPDVLAKGAVLLLGSVFGFLVLAGGPRKAPNQFLAAFLFLVAANQGFEAWRAYSPGQPYDLLLMRLAYVAACLDPLMLYYFASIYPERNALNRAPFVAAIVMGTAALSLVAFLHDTSARQPWTLVARTQFPFLAYAAVFAHFWGQLRRSPADPVLQHGFAAACFVFFPSVAALVGSVWNLYLLARYGTLLIPFVRGATTFFLVVLIIAVPAAVAFLSARGLGAGIPYRWAPGAAAALVGLLWLPSLLGAVGLPASNFAAFELLPAFRWLCFSLFMSVAILRFRMLDITMERRRVSAKVLVAIGFAAIAGGLLLLVEAAGFALPLSGVEVGILAIAVVASQRFDSVIERVGRMLYGIPRKGDLSAAMDTYSAALEETRREGKPMGGPELLRLERELGLDDRIAGVLRRIAETEDAGPLAPGRLFAGRYRVQKLLARGGSGRVFLATDELLQRDVVLKELLHEEGGAHEVALHEARFAGKLQHPHVTVVHDVVEQPGSSVVVMEHLGGGSLADRLSKGPRLTVDEVVSVGADVLAALDAVHDRGVVHRDIKPGNILFTRDGRAKLSDFGVAQLQRQATLAGYRPPTRAGTPGYLAPEQMEGGAATPQTDLYALGKVLRDAAASPLPAELEAVLARALERDPARRWVGARAMSDALLPMLPAHRRLL